MEETKNKYEFKIVKDTLEELDPYLRASALALVISQTDDVLFRPAFKHGYPDLKLQALWKKIEENHDAVEFLYALRSSWWELLKENDISNFGW